MPRIEKHRFEGGGGAYELVAIIDRPDGPTLGHAVFAHCFTCTKDIKAAYYTSRALAAEGIAVLRFDFAGLGESGGDFTQATFSSHVDDVVAAASYLRQRGEAPALLVGHSLGGTASLAAARQLPEVRAVATIASPLEPVTLRRHLGQLTLEDAPELIPIRGTGVQTIEVGRRFFLDLERYDMRATVGQLGKALLVCHAPEDEVVDQAEARRIYDAAAEPRSIIALPGAGHLLLDRRQGTYLGRLIAAWARRYIEQEDVG